MKPSARILVTVAFGSQRVFPGLAFRAFWHDPSTLSNTVEKYSLLDTSWVKEHSPSIHESSHQQGFYF